MGRSTAARTDPSVPTSTTLRRARVTAVYSSSRVRTREEAPGSSDHYFVELRPLRSVHRHRESGLDRSQPRRAHRDHAGSPPEGDPEAAPHLIALSMSDHRAGVPIEKAEAVVVLGHDDRPPPVPASLWWRAFPEVGQPLLGSGVPGGGAGRPVAMCTEEAQPSQGVKGGRAIARGRRLDQGPMCLEEGRPDGFETGSVRPRLRRRPANGRYWR